MSARYIEVGTVSPVPDDLRQALDSLSEELGGAITYGNRTGLAGPNDILHLVMSAEYWAALLPWALEALGRGALGFVGGLLVAKTIKTKQQKQLEQLQLDVDRILEKVQETKTDWGADWELFFGIKGARHPESRAIVGNQVSSKQEAANAIIKLALLGDKIEDLIDRHFGEDPEDTAYGTHVVGSPEICEDGSIQVKLAMRRMNTTLAVTRLKLTPDGKFEEGPAE